MSLLSMIDTVRTGAVVSFNVCVRPSLAAGKASDGLPRTAFSVASVPLCFQLLDAQRLETQRHRGHGETNARRASYQIRIAHSSGYRNNEGLTTTTRPSAELGSQVVRRAGNRQSLSPDHARSVRTCCTVHWILLSEAVPSLRCFLPLQDGSGLRREENTAETGRPQRNALALRVAGARPRQGLAQRSGAAGRGAREAKEEYGSCS